MMPIVAACCGRWFEAAVADEFKDVISTTSRAEEGAFFESDDVKGVGKDALGGEGDVVVVVDVAATLPVAWTASSDFCAEVSSEAPEKGATPCTRGTEPMK